MIGRADGALAGYFPQPAMGFFHGAGPALFDDFHWQQSATARPGALGWGQNNIVTTATFAQQTGTDTEWGVRRITTSTTLNSGGTIASAAQLKEGIPPIGSVWYAKLRISSTVAGTTLWSGWGTSTSTVPVAAGATELCGVRCEGAGNWFGVCKTGAGVETTVDLGIDASVWRIVGFEVVDTGSGVKGVQFFWINASDRRVMQRTNVGTPITTTHPTGSLWALGLSVVNTVGAARSAEIDFWGLGGRTAR